MCSLQKRLFRYCLYRIREVFQQSKAKSPKSFAETNTKNEAKIKNESETSTLASTVICNETINPENVDISTFTKKIVNDDESKSKQIPIHSHQS